MLFSHLDTLHIPSQMSESLNLMFKNLNEH